MSRLSTTNAVRRPHSRTRLFVIALAGVTIGAAIGWAGSVVFAPTTPGLQPKNYTYVRAVHGSIGSQISLSASASWDISPLADNASPGTVTTVDVTSGQFVSEGTVLYTVDLRPVVIAKGSIPSFEDMASGSKGLDVAQLQTMLHDLGYYSGKLDGVFSASTRAGVVSWQQHLGEVVTGRVARGDIVFVPSLPVRIVLDSTLVKVGASVGGGEAAIGGLASAPGFNISATGDQSTFFKVGAEVDLTSPGGKRWVSFVSRVEPTTQGGVQVDLAGKDGSSICGSDCQTIPAVGQSLLDAQVITVPTRVGIIVPSAALVSEPNGQTEVLTRSGKKVEVTVVASANGMSIVTGLPLGGLIRVPGST